MSSDTRTCYPNMLPVHATLTWPSPVRATRACYPYMYGLHVRSAVGRVRRTVCVYSCTVYVYGCVYGLAYGHVWRFAGSKPHSS